MYDLLVEHDHEFFANDLLVANCRVWCEELAAWRYLDECFEQMEFGLRAGPDPRWVGSTTPKPRPLIKQLYGGKIRGVVVTRATTFDNPHLPESVREKFVDRYAHRQLGRQELYADLLEADENALWTREALERGRVLEAPPGLVRVSVGVDPSGGAGEQGIVVVGKTLEDLPRADGRPRLLPHGYALADRSCRLGPDGWGRRAVQAAIDFEADDVVVEENFGGDMALATVAGAAEALGVSVPVRKVRASRGKRVRAEPVAALSEGDRPRWHHVGFLEELEAQLCTWTPESGYSPDRLDAAVWPGWHLRIVTLAARGSGSFGGSAVARARIA